MKKKIDKTNMVGDEFMDIHLTALLFSMFEF